MLNLGPPFPAGIFEVADQLPLLRVHRSAGSTGPSSFKSAIPRSIVEREPPGRSDCAIGAPGSAVGDCRREARSRFAPPLCTVRGSWGEGVRRLPRAQHA